MEAMLASLIVDQQEMVKHFDGHLDRHSGQQERHRAELESLKTQGDKHSHNQEEIISECEFLKAQILSMEGQLCRCGKESPKWKGKGVVSNPLEYESEVLGSYHCPQGTLSSRSSYHQDTSPIPVPVPEPTGRSLTISTQELSDKENVVPKAVKSAPILMELISVVEETESDREVREVSNKMDNKVCWKIFHQRCWMKRKGTHPYAGGHQGFPQLGCEINLRQNTRRVIKAERCQRDHGASCWGRGCATSLELSDRSSPPGGSSGDDNGGVESSNLGVVSPTPHLVW